VHTLRMTILGFVVLAIFFLGARLLNRGEGKPVDGAWIFIWVWLVAAVINMLVGVFAAGISLVIEIPVLAVVFGLPALVAWYLSRNYGPRPTS
jgi:hypothetical protein